jgi:hypothetical protein
MNVFFYACRRHYMGQGPVSIGKDFLNTFFHEPKKVLLTIAGFLEYSRSGTGTQLNWKSRWLSEVEALEHILCQTKSLVVT